MQAHTLTVILNQLGGSSSAVRMGHSTYTRWNSQAAPPTASLQVGVLSCPIKQAIIDCRWDTTATKERVIQAFSKKSIEQLGVIKETNTLVSLSSEYRSSCYLVPSRHADVLVCVQMDPFTCTTFILSSCRWSSETTLSRKLKPICSLSIPPYSQVETLSQELRLGKAKLGRHQRVPPHKDAEVEEGIPKLFRKK